MKTLFVERLQAATSIVTFKIAAPGKFSEAAVRRYF